MVDGEPTNTPDTDGKEVDKPVEKPDENLSIVDEAKKVRDEIKAENDRREAILAKEQKLYADKMLGGRSEAGQQPAKEPEVSDVDYAKKAMSGEFNEKK